MGMPRVNRQPHGRPQKGWGKMTDRTGISKAKPILFQTGMVQAILRDRDPKTATRRPVRPQPKKSMVHKLGWCMAGDREDIGKYGFGSRPHGGDVMFARPPCELGDILYVRETWKFIPCIECVRCWGGDACGNVPVTYVDSHSIAEGCFAYRASHPRPERLCWRPSIHMPKAAARIFLKVTDVQVGRLQGIGLEGIMEEGVCPMPLPESHGRPPGGGVGSPDSRLKEARERFARLWDSTVRKADIGAYGWDADPWVWEIKFERVDGSAG